MDEAAQPVSAVPAVDSRKLTGKAIALALLMILAGLPFRAALLERFYLDFDESMYFQVAQEPTLADTWEASRIHTHPPLAFVVYHYWLRVGDAEWIVRLPSVLFGIVAACLCYLWLTRVTDRRAALVGLFVLTFAMPVIHVSAQMRSYTMLFTFVFGALLFHDSYLQRERWRDLIGELICLCLALLTHYATAWIVLTLGIGGLFHAQRRGVLAKGTRAWVVQQVLLATFCVWLYLSHVRGFVGSETQSALWDEWLYDNPFGDGFVGRLNFTLLSAVKFFRFVYGPIWMLAAVATFIGAGLLAKQEVDRSGSGLAAVDRTVLTLLPLVLAAVLNVLLIYPLGPTRHSLWLMPFLVLAVAGAAKSLLDRPGRSMRIGLAIVCVGWAWIYPFRTTFQTTTTLTPQLMRETAASIRGSDKKPGWIPKGDLILTDDSTRNVLAYYLRHPKVDRGRDLGHGFREFRIEGYRIVVIPKFHFFQYSLREDWEHFTNVVGEQATQPLWLVYFGFEVEDNDPKLIARRLPPSTVLARGGHGDNRVFRVQFSAPPQTTTAEDKTESKPLPADRSVGDRAKEETTQADKTESPAGASS